MQAIKDYENNKWKVIGQKVGKPAKVRNMFPSHFPTHSLTSVIALLCSGHIRITTRSRLQHRLRYALTSRFDHHRGLSSSLAPH